MRTLALATVLLFAAAPADAQGPKLDAGTKTEKKDPARAAAEEQAYKSSLQRIPAKEAVSDPWGSVRSDGNPSSQGSTKKLMPASPAR